MFVFIYEGEKRTKEREIGKTQEGKEEGSLWVEMWCRVMCVSVSMRGCPSQQLASLNSVIEMTNRAAFFAFLQKLKLAILSLSSHSWSPRLWNWLLLWAHSWSDSMLVVGLFVASLVAVTFTGVLCSFKGGKKRICGGISKSHTKGQSHNLEKHVEIQHHAGNCFLLKVCVCN